MYVTSGKHPLPSPPLGPVLPSLCDTHGSTVQHLAPYWLGTYESQCSVGTTPHAEERFITAVLPAIMTAVPWKP